MKNKIIASLLTAAAVLCSAEALAQDKAQEAFREDYFRAVELYGHGMFARAETIFREIYDESGDVMAKGYKVLCAVRLQEEGYEKTSMEFVTEHPASILVPQIHFYNALNHFDRQEYAAAVEDFAAIDINNLEDGQIAEFSFKQAYSYFETGNLETAEKYFERSEKMPVSDYTAPSRFALGYINYSQKDFREALTWFGKAKHDPRFSSICGYYEVECHFMLKDYDYVLDEGVEVYEAVPAERQQHLARMISEAYLIKGDAESAKVYYEKIAQSLNDMSREDYFYAGSLLYALNDYQGAIDNYSRIKYRTDSLGQIANYQMADCYLQTGNKVEALNCFKAASERSYNPDIEEDAHINYAKLSFDLNHNPSVFTEYLRKYPDNRKGEQIYSYMALACLYNHDYAGAVEAYSNIDELDEDQRANYMKANYLRANDLISNGSWTDAIPYLRAASFYQDRRDPFSQLAKYWTAECYYRSDQFDKALETFTELYNMSALQGKAEGRLIPYDMAYCNFRLGNYDAAAKWFSEYLASGSSLEQGEDAAVRRGDCDFVQRDFKSAVARYEEAMSRFSYKDNLYPNYRAGVAYGLLGQADKKIETLSRAMDASSSASYYSETMYELGRAYVDANMSDQAISVFTALRDRTADKTISAQALLELGMISRNMSEYDQAINYYKMAVFEMPGTEYSESALLALESIYESQGRMDEYLDFADQSGAIKDKTESEKEEMYFNAAEQLYLTENYAKALASLQNFLQRYPNGSKAATATFYAAECYKWQDKKEQACEWYSKAIENGLSGDAAQSAMLNFSALSYELQRYRDAYGGYSSLLSEATTDNNRHTARLGMMRSAYKSADYQSAISCAAAVSSDKGTTQDEKREADYITAKSYLSTNEREKAYELFASLSSYPSTDEGAEAAYMIIQDACDRGEYADVETKVYAFSEKAGGQNYWLAKAFITLGDAFAEQGNYAQAKATFESVRDGYQPSGSSDDVLDNARMRLEKLEKLMNEQDEQ